MQKAAAEYEVSAPRSTSKPNLRASNPSRCIRGWVPDRHFEPPPRGRVSNPPAGRARIALAADDSAGPGRYRGVAGSTAFSAGPREGIVMKAKRIYTPSRIVAL